MLLIGFHLNDKFRNHIDNYNHLKVLQGKNKAQGKNIAVNDIHLQTQD